MVLPMYRELLESYIKDHNWARLQKPCTEEEIQETEKYVGYSFPDDLKNLLRETDGDHWLLMSSAEIKENVKTNREIFSEYLEADEFEEKVNRFIFFGTNGCGDYYCYKVLSDGRADDSAVYIWEHELFEVRRVADNISDLIKKYYSDEI